MRKSIILVISLALVSAILAWWYAKESAEESRAQDTALRDGIRAFESKAYQQALDALRQVPSDHAQAWMARYLQGSSQIMLRDYSAAIPPLEEALALNPSHTRTMHALGVAHFKLGHLALAKAYFAQVLEIDPTDEEARGLMDIMASLERQQPGNSSQSEE